MMVEGSRPSIRILRDQWRDRFVPSFGLFILFFEFVFLHKRKCERNIIIALRFLLFVLALILTFSSQSSLSNPTVGIFSDWAAFVHSSKKQYLPLFAIKENGTNKQEDVKDGQIKTPRQAKVRRYLTDIVFTFRNIEASREKKQECKQKCHHIKLQ